MMCDTREHVASVCLISYGPSLRDLCAHRLQMVVNYLKLGRWMARQGFEVGRRLPDRTAVFDAVAAKVRERDVRITALENELAEIKGLLTKLSKNNDPTEIVESRNR